MSWRLTLDRDPKMDAKRYELITSALSPGSASPEHYVATDEIIAAVNTAVQLGKPLLVAGEPGVGKTALAKYVAMRFGLFEEKNDDEKPEVLRFDVKSTTKGADLIYRYDAIGHFRESRIEGKDVDHTKFVELEALGRAIILANPTDAKSKSKKLNDLIGRYRPKAHRARPTVVLIDEIDKAPRDVPNDLLRELDEMAFKIPELGADAMFETERTKDSKIVRPIVIITTNDERPLPNAFLRRCCYLHISFPDRDTLDRIVGIQIGERWKEQNLSGDAITLVHRLHQEDARVSKKPGTAELLDFILELEARGADPDARLWKLDYGVGVAQAVFAKHKDDPDRIKTIMEELGKGA